MRGVRPTAAGLLVLLLSACSGGAGAEPGRPIAAVSPSQVPTPTLPASPSPSPSPSLPPLSLEPLAELPSVVWAGAAPGERGNIWVVLRSGTIRRLDAAGAPLGEVLDLRDEVSTGNEQGLLSMAFDPGFTTNRRIYVNYTDTEGDTRVVAYTLVRGVAVRPEVLLAIDQPYPNLNGGGLRFDRTGMLLVGTGDGGNAGDPAQRAQDLDSMLGKILRIHPRSGQPAAGNPYPQNPYVWALGLRNPWRFTFDTNGDLYLADVGQNKVEELDVVPSRYQRGANFGWSVYEGDVRFAKDREFTPGGPLIAPALTYSHDEGRCSITGGEVYRGTAIPWLHGSYVYGDYCRGRLLAVTRTSTGVSEPLDLDVHANGLIGFGLDAEGELLVMSLDSVHRLVPGA